MRFCSASNIAPLEVDEAVVDRFMGYRAQSGMSADDAFRRLLARAWNANVGTIQGWPARRLMEPPVKAAVEVAWEEFPEGLRRDVEQYLQGLTRVRRSRTGQRIRPLKPSTIGTRRAELVAAARMAVKAGVPIEVLNSLSALLAPDVAEKVLDAYWCRNGENPKLFTINLAAQVPRHRERDQMPGRGCLRAPRPDAAGPRGAPSGRADRQEYRSRSGRSSPPASGAA